MEDVEGIRDEQEVDVIEEEGNESAVAEEHGATFAKSEKGAQEICRYRSRGTRSIRCGEYAKILPAYSFTR
jgi:hypothetical protein